MPNKFTSLEVSWGQHARFILITFATQLLSRCYPYVDIDGVNYSAYYEDPIYMGKWVYLRCAVDLNTQQHYTNKNAEKLINPALPSFVKNNVTTLRIVDYTDASNLNYGFSFIREIKLWSSYNFTFYDTSRL